jgi:DNA-binding transcriptional regulator YiaG
MTPDAYRTALDRLGLTHAEAARMLGVDARTSRRWASGARKVPEPVQRLLWACEADADLLAALLERHP